MLEGNPGNPTALSVPPVEINGTSSAYWQRKEIYTANNPAEKLEIFA
jgi:hypothetical protein